MSGFGIFATVVLALLVPVLFQVLKIAKAQKQFHKEMLKQLEEIRNDMRTKLLP